MLIFVVIFILLHANQPFASNNIVYPWRAAKIIVESGTGFEILFNNLKADSIDSVIVEGPFNKVGLNIDSVELGHFVYDPYTRASVNTKILVDVADDTPEELYDLIIKTKGETFRSNKSVQVIQEFKKNHTILHISDLHISRQWVGDYHNGYAKELELLDKFVEVANIIGPDFILVTGDNIHESTRTFKDPDVPRSIEIQERPLVEEKWRSYYEGAKGLSGIHGFNAPTFTTTGNHDFYGVYLDDYFAKSLQWNTMNGKRVFGFSYGDTRVLVADNYLGDPESDRPSRSPLSGLQGEVLESFLEENGHGELRIIAQHAHNMIDTNFIDKHKVDIIANGHSHTPNHNYIGSTPTLNIRPGTVSNIGTGNTDTQLGYFRIFRIEGSTFEFSPPLRFTDEPTVPVDTMSVNLTLNFDEPNDGTADSNRGVIHNNLSYDLYDCKIRFVMKKGKYEVNNGNIYQVIKIDDFSIIDVKVDVNHNEKVEVEIKQTS